MNSQEPCNEQFKRPTDNVFESYALQGMHYARRKQIADLTVLVYMSAPQTLIYNPVHYANTKYHKSSFSSPDVQATVTVVIGEID